jgi:putative salt-induced outer membrane protein
MTIRPAPLLAGLLAVAPAIAFAQATVKPDDQFHYALGAGASYSSGNTSAASVNVSGDGIRMSDHDKLRFGGKALWSRDDGTKTAENLTLGTQYDRDIDPVWFGFGSADFLRDQFANISARYSLHGGVGRHLIKRDDLTFDVSTGLGYTEDRYVDAADIQGRLRDRYGRLEALVAEESTHQWTQSTSIRQKLSLFPALRSGGGYRGVFDSGLAVSMTPTLSLTVGLSYRYDSDPGVGLKKGDALFVTGISVKID